MKIRSGVLVAAFVASAQSLLGAEAPVLPEWLASCPPCDDVEFECSQISFASACDSAVGCCGCGATCGDGCCEPWTPFLMGDALAVPSMAVTNQGAQFFHRPVVRPGTNNSPFPRNRLSFEYRLLGDAMTFEDPLAPSVGGDQKENLDMFVLRLERTFLDDLFSIDVIAPFIVGPASFNSTADGAPNEDGEFGDLTFNLKMALIRRGAFILSAGLQIETPTAETLDNPGGGLFDYRVSDDAWHFTPYVAAAASRGRAFVQGFVSYRMATQDEDVFDPTTNVFAHTVRDPDALMVDLNLGYWVYQGGHGSLVRGMAPMLELNYFSSQEDQQFISTGNVGLVDRGIGTVDYLTITAGLTTQFRKGSTLTIGASAPLRDNETFIPPVVYEGPTDRFYNWSLIVQYNHLRW